MDMQTPTIIETGNGLGNGFGGFGVGSGFIGGLILGSLWNGNGFGFGGNRGGGQAVADIGLANSIEHVSDQVTSGTISQLQSSQDIVNTINTTAMATNGAINQNTISDLQSSAQMSDKLSGATFGLSQQIDRTGDQTVAAITQNTIEGMRNTQATNDRLCCINNNITAQGYENRLQSQALAAQISSGLSDISRQIYEENCKDRELQREIQYQSTRDQLTQAQANVAALTAQINLTNSLSAQTAYLVSQLRPTTSSSASTTS